MSQLSENLKWLREYNQLTQDEVAKACYLERSTYTNYELDKTTPNINVLSAICELFKVDLNDILDRDLTGLVSNSRAKTISEKISREEMSLINNYRFMDFKRRSILLQVAQVFADVSKTNSGSVG